MVATTDPRRQEVAGHLDGLVDEPTTVVSQVEHEGLGAALPQAGDGAADLLPGALGERRQRDVADLRAVERDQA